jgi:hypothetical protein
MTSRRRAAVPRGGHNEQKGRVVSDGQVRETWGGRLDKQPRAAAADSEARLLLDGRLVMDGRVEQGALATGSTPDMPSSDTSALCAWGRSVADRWRGSAVYHFCAALLPASFLLLLTTSEIPGLLVVASHLVPSPANTCLVHLATPTLFCQRQSSAPLSLRGVPSLVDTAQRRQRAQHFFTYPWAPPLPLLITRCSRPTRLHAPVPSHPNAHLAPPRSSTPHRRHDGRNLCWVGRLHQESRPPP